VSFHEQLRDRLVPKYSELVYNGFWSSPEREALQTLVTETQRGVTCVVRLKLYEDNIIVAGCKSPKRLCDRKIPMMEGDASAYDQTDAIGFIRLNALRLKLRVVLKSKGSGD
jgi:argininosuccinate synthase